MLYLLGLDAFIVLYLEMLFLLGGSQVRPFYLKVPRSEDRRLATLAICDIDVTTQESLLEFMQSVGMTGGTLSLHNSLQQRPNSQRSSSPSLEHRQTFFTCSQRESV